MLLPSRVYESLPYAYMVGGLLLVFGAIYVGPGVPMFTIYVSLGVGSIFTGIAVCMRRKEARRLRPHSLTDESTE